MTIEFPAFGYLISVPADSQWHQVGVNWLLKGDAEFVVLDLQNLGTSPISGFKMQRGLQDDSPNLHLRDWLVNSDFDSQLAPEMISVVSSTNVGSQASPGIQSLPANGWGSIRFEQMQGIAGLAFFVRAAAPTTFIVRAAAFPPKRP